MTSTLWNTAAAFVTMAPALDGAEPRRKPSGPVPWGIDIRPMPEGTNLQALLPKRIGDFTRDELPKGALLKSDEDLVIVYRGLGAVISATSCHEPSAFRVQTRT